MKQRSLVVMLACSLIGMMLTGCATGPRFTDEQQAVMQLDYQSFDQTMGEGWRAWAQQQEFAEAARMLDHYAKMHGDELSPSELRIIRFHAGQMYGFDGNRSRAIARFRDSFNPDEPPDGFKWNAYVRGTIAFLEGDMAALEQSRDELLEQGAVEMQMPDGTVITRVPNLDVLERFIEHFERTYREAYSGQIDDGSDHAEHDGH